jgi:hypothetical protein
MLLPEMILGMERPESSTYTDFSCALKIRRTSCIVKLSALPRNAKSEIRHCSMRYRLCTYTV